MIVRSQGKRSMAVHPAGSLGFAPGGLFIKATQPFGNNALILLFLVPDRPLGPVHHLVRANNPVLTQAQEIAEK